MRSADLDRCRIREGQPLKLTDFDPASRPASSGHRGRDEARLEKLGKRLGELQQLLYASKQSSLLLVLQGMDTSGKDGVVRRVFSTVSPLGVHAHAFGVPVGVETRHDFLWRVHACVPALGEITVFNRSHYEDVIAARVRKLAPLTHIRKRIRHIREFEQLLFDEGTRILKCFLHISRREQGKRLQDRLDTPDKQWKLQSADLQDRRHWADYRRAYQEAIPATSTGHAPWYVIPADSHFQRDLMVAELLVRELESMQLRFPPSTLPADTRIPE